MSTQHYSVFLSFEGASGEYSDDMTLRDDIWSEISSAAGLDFDFDFNGEVYVTVGVTKDSRAKEKMQALKQTIESGSIDEFYLKGGKVQLTLDDEKAHINIAFDFDDDSWDDILKKLK